MDILVFDIKGRFAHFRKFYTNSSSLSYSVPPRTTIEGIIASIMGYERDSYYNDLSANNLKIAVKKNTRTKKLIQSLNYIKATSSSELINPKDHTQIPFEMITGENGVSYRVYVHHTNKAVMDKINYRITNRKYHYIPYLGAAPFSCITDYIGNFEAIEHITDDYVEINTIIRQSLIMEKGIDIKEAGLSLVKEKMPRDFYENRIVKEIEDYIYDENGKPLKVKLKKSYYTVNNENIVLI